jgi:hypothetical protein
MCGVELERLVTAGVAALRVTRDAMPVESRHAPGAVPHRVQTQPRGG